MKVEMEHVEDGWRKLRMVGWNGMEEEEFLRLDWSEVVELKVEEVESWDARKRWMKLEKLVEKVRHCWIQDWKH
jgi:hypothetical protein